MGAIIGMLLPSLVSTGAQLLFPKGSPDWMKWVEMLISIFANGQDVPDKIRALDDRIKAMVAAKRSPTDAEYNAWLVNDVGQSDDIEAAARAHGFID